MSLPHITNIQAARNREEPDFNSIFEITFTLPALLQQKYQNDIAVLNESIVSIGGLDTLNKTAGISQQKWFGVEKSYYEPLLDATHLELPVVMNLSLKNGTNNYIYKLIKDWGRLSYNILTGERHLDADCTADWLKIQQANKAGDVYREIVCKDVKIKDITGKDTFDKNSNEPAVLGFTLITDYATDIDA